MQANRRPWRKWYGLARWRRLREQQLSLHPLCAFCLEREIIEEAEVVDHITPHKGDPELFWDAENIQSLCKPCHDRDKQLIELGRPIVTFSTNGWPVE